MIRYDHYTDKFVKVSDRECPWCKAVCASTDKYCHECGWHIADTPQTEKSDSEYYLELADAVMRGEMSDAGANQAWYEHINKKDAPQTEVYDYQGNGKWERSE